jgi:NitT/TauT family transport system substrate-binding protein
MSKICLLTGIRMIATIVVILVAPVPTTVFAQIKIDPSQRIVLVVDEYKAIRNFPLIVAERLGYLRSEKFDVTVVNVRDDIFHAELLADGRADAVMAYYHHNVVNNSEVRPSKAIMTLGTTPGMKVLVSTQAKDRIKTLPDLKGARVLSGGDGSSKTTIANALALKGGLELNDYVRLPTYGKEKNAQLLKEGKADVLIAPVPEGDYYESIGVASVWLDLTSLEQTQKALGNAFPSSTVFMATDRIKAKPEIAQHLALAFFKSLNYINTHSPEQILELIPVAITGKDRTSYLAMLKQEYGMFSGNGCMPPSAVLQELNVLKKFNNKYKDVQVESTYDNDFLKGVASCM